MKVKVDSKGAENALRKRLNDLTKDKSLLNDIGLTAVKNSVASVRLGKAPSSGEALAPFSGNNSDRYIERRKVIASSQGSGANFRAGKSNLTLTGQLLKSIKHFIKGSTITIRATGTHKPYTQGGKSVSNEQLANWHSEGAGGLPKREVIGVSEKVRDIISAKVKAFVRRNITNLRR